MIFLALVAIALAFIILLNSYKNSQRKKKALEEIRENWGRPADAYRNFRLISAYSDHLHSDPLTTALAGDIDLENLFHYVDRTNSKPGQQYLYAKLRKPETNLDKLLDFDRLIEQLSAYNEKRETISTELQRLNNSNCYYLHQLFNSRAELDYAPLARLYIRFSGILWLGSLVLTIMLHNQYFFFMVMGITLANFYLHFTNKEKIFAFVHSLPQLKTLINVSKNVSEQIQTKGTEQAQKSTNNLKPLKRKLGIISLESGINKDPTDLAYGIWELLKILFLIEPRAFINAIDEVNTHRDDIRNVFNYVAEIDAAISVQSLRVGLPYFCKPKFENGGDTLEIVDLYHPLISNCVPNSLTAKFDQGVLITGSNMSGKTTFIRSIAVNTLLAQTLYTSTSQSYKAPLLDICSSINMADSLNESKSYFQAEAISIFNIIEHVKANNGNCLIIIDEIFRGTNTIERVAAARAILSYLTANRNFVFVSTHDLELAELLGEEYAVYSFEEMASDERLVFDYKIKPGILKHKNAIAVLKSLGYPDSVIENATKVSDELSKKYT